MTLLYGSDAPLSQEWSAPSLMIFRTTRWWNHTKLLHGQNAASWTWPSEDSTPLIFDCCAFDVHVQWKVELIRLEDAKQSLRFVLKFLPKSRWQIIPSLCYLLVVTHAVNAVYMHTNTRSRVQQSIQTHPLLNIFLFSWSLATTRESLSCHSLHDIFVWFSYVPLITNGLPLYWWSFERQVSLQRRRSFDRTSLIAGHESPPPLKTCRYTTVAHSLRKRA